MIQKYMANILDTGESVIGYISEQREYSGNGSYSGGIEYLISVTEVSMPSSKIRGCFIVDPKSIKRWP